MEALETELLAYERERGKPAPSYNHSIVQANLGFELCQRLGKTNTVVMELNLLLNSRKTVPDLAVFPKRPPDMQRDILWVEEAPLVTVEILTLKQDLDSLLDKVRAYLAAGVKSCWIVIPGISTIAVFTGPSTYRSFAHDSTPAVRDEVLGVEIPLADIFGA